ncbi:LOW QUALITY PROTEIN: protein phosphatase 1 regulatory subunit 32-like [Haliotis rubra]|uniref:LOW QUALITY PROTEIN: protein phosphatase 1 regulatory subunit 32-like n=1 Tax=Haliotis rubra TaxID=36100 RepID=UPI001EE5DDFE|nr:LOW QUALITY PROTEIN: protein phosphatase 1 regulatory subunit 32-like [Haliotis rubra]
MGPLPKGSRNVHINKSHGPDTNMMKFYVTQNSTTYGRFWDNYKPRQGRHTGTGYKSNFRPSVYYSQRLDEVDNPVMGRICGDNYITMTTKDFQPYKENTGMEPLPQSTHHTGSGFVRQKPITNPTNREVQGVFVDTRAASAPADILPRGKPLLHKLKPKDPVELENNGYGPKSMVSETHERFKGQQGNHLDPNQLTVGPQQDTGFTHSYSVEPVTYQPMSAFKNEQPGYFTNRPTGISVMKTSFLPTEYPRGKEPLPNLAAPSDHDSGFTRERAKPLYVHRRMGDAYDKAGDIPNMKLDKTLKRDPTEFINMHHPDNHSSVSMNVYRGLQNPPPSEAGRLGRTATGQQEASGYSNNSDRFIQTSDDPRRFLTHYMTRFTDITPMGMEREGHCRGGVQQQKPDGFTKSTSVHVNGADINTTDTLRRLEPYVSRSIKARDVFYDDHLHDAKSQRLTRSALVH